MKIRSEILSVALLNSNEQKPWRVLISLSQKVEVIRLKILRVTIQDLMHVELDVENCWLYGSGV